MKALSDRGDVLVIKLSALGDFVQALGPMKAIREHHKDQRLVLLTTQPFVDLARATNWFDDVWVDTRPGILDLLGWLTLRRKFSNAGFSRVYDLQTSVRSSLYHHLLFTRKPDWSGVAYGCSHPHDNPRRDYMHTLDRQREQLEVAGVPAIAQQTFEWVAADVSRFGLGQRYGLLVPGGAAHRPEKRWPAAHFGEIAARMWTQGIQPVIVGSPDEEPLAAEIKEKCPQAVSLIGRTSLLELATLAQGAALALGNDTGPMHMAAAAGCRSAVLFSFASDPDLCAPRGPLVSILRRENLADLQALKVAKALGL